jgi:anti-sigma factor RsiW
MIGCENRQAMLNSLLDGELDAVNAAAAEAHIASCRECRDEFERLRAVREAIARSGARHRAPDGLLARIDAALPAPVASARRRSLPSWLAPGVAGALAASLTFVLIGPPRAPSSLDDELIAGHVRSLQVAHLTDVRTSDEHLVRPWFNGKIDFAPPVPELARYGFPLAGGRLDYLNGRTVPALVYRRRLHTINLFVWPAAQTGGRQLQKGGYALDEWSAGGLRYAAVSDIAPAELEQFRKAFVASTGAR